MDDMLVREAYGREAVVLVEKGSAVTFTADRPANRLMVRYGLPYGIPRDEMSTLSLYVNEKKIHVVPMTTYRMHLSTGYGILPRTEASSRMSRTRITASMNERNDHTATTARGENRSQRRAW